MVPFRRRLLGRGVEGVVVVGCGDGVVATRPALGELLIGGESGGVRHHARSRLGLEHYLHRVERLVLARDKKQFLVLRRYVSKSKRRSLDR